MHTLVDYAYLLAHMQWNNTARTREAFSMLTRASAAAQRYRSSASSSSSTNSKNNISSSMVAGHAYDPITDITRISADAPLSSWQSVLAHHRACDFQYWWINRFAP